MRTAATVMNIQSQDASMVTTGARAESGKPRRVLFVAYAFPPVGGVSVQRVTKFIKYLPAFGWTSSVLTVANPSVPLIDNTLVDEIPAGTLIRRARTLEPGYGLKTAISTSHGQHRNAFGAKVLKGARDAARKVANHLMQPDFQILWRPYALREGLKLLREVHHDAIIATGPPFSSLLLGMTLSKRTGVPLIVDFRDEWTMMTYWENKNFGRIEKFVQGRMQARVLKAAKLVICTTPSTADQLRSHVKDANGDAEVHSIYNGFDASDYPKALSAEDRVDYGNGVKLFRMAFTGSLWNVTPINPIVESILELSRRRPDLVEKLELVIAGRRTNEQEAELDRLASTRVKLVRLPFIAHKEAIRLMCESDSLLLINADLPNAERLINAKSFEYMGTRKPIFVVAPPGDLWRLLEGIPGALMARPRDVATITANLETAIGRWQQGAAYTESGRELSKFERRHLAGSLAGLLDELATARAR